MSLDGYIADENGGVDWLNELDCNGTDDSYSMFIGGVDTVLMGWNTYFQIVTELSPSEWIYDGLETYVVTHRKMESSERVRFTDRSPAQLIMELKRCEGKDIWICGGANLINQLMSEDVIDRYYVSVIPIILGSGIRLFDRGQNVKLKLSNTHVYRNDIVELIYERL